jgi:hypothetical protein
MALIPWSGSLGESKSDAYFFKGCDCSRHWRYPVQQLRDQHGNRGGRSARGRAAITSPGISQCAQILQPGAGRAISGAASRLRLPPATVHYLLRVRAGAGCGVSAAVLSAGLLWSLVQGAGLCASLCARPCTLQLSLGSRSLSPVTLKLFSVQAAVKLCHGTRNRWPHRVDDRAGMARGFRSEAYSDAPAIAGESLCVMCWRT